MSVRFKLWLGMMACAAVLLAVAGLLALLLGTWLAAGVLALVLFAPLAWLLGSLAYAPVRDVTKTARRITTTGQLDRRCFYPGPRDDVGDLVAAVNELLVRHDAAIGRLQRLYAAEPACDCQRDASAPDPADLVLELPPRDDPQHPAGQQPSASQEAEADLPNRIVDVQVHQHN